MTGLGYTTMRDALTRRTLLASTAAAVAGGVSPAADPPTLIESIEKQTLLRGRDGSGPTWFHPRACMVPGERGPMAFMTLQTILASDTFGPVHWMTSTDLGRSWTAPEPVPPRWPVYAVWRDGRWGPRRRLAWNDPRGGSIYSNGCGQRIVLPDGDILLALRFSATRDQPKAVATTVCRFDGDELSIRRVGEELRHDAGRGLLEPSLVRFGDRILITLRAEDGRGYVAASADGLTWGSKQAWAWDDGEPLEMSTTQQHWLAHSDALFLVYTRRDASNVNVFRWRSPLWMAEVDPHSLRLRRATERVVLPLVGDGVNDPDRVAIMGNFHVTHASADESWVTVGEWQPKNGIHGDLLMARICWTRTNGLARGGAMTD